MGEDRDVKQARQLYALLIEQLDDMDWKYTRDDEELSITCNVGGEDLPMKLRMIIDQKLQLLTLHSVLPFNAKEDKRLEVARAISVINFQILVDGNFEMDITDGQILFRITSNYKECLIGKEMFKHMILISCVTIDKFNDKIFAVNQGLLKAEDMIKAVT